MPQVLAARSYLVVAFDTHVILRGSVMQCVAVCCSVLQCVAVCCSVLQCVAVCCSGLQIVAFDTHVILRGFSCGTHTQSHTHTHM